MTGLLGHRPDDRVTHPPAAQLVGAAPPPPAGGVSLLNRLPRRVQQSLEDCVVHAIGYAMLIVLVLLGIPNPPLLSRRAAYWAARKRDGGPIVDTGCQPRHALEALQELGYLLETSCPYEPERVLEPPDASVWRQAFDQVGAIQAYRLPEGGEARLLAMRQALAAGHPCVIALRIDAVFLAGAFAGPWSRTGEDEGGHYVVVVGYDEHGDFQIVNSWGEDWHGDGTATIAAQTIANGAEAQDGYVLTAVRPSSEVA